MKKITNGLLIILEGGEGVGKSTQAKALVEYYNSKGYNAKYFREPGGNKIAEDIRNMILYNEMDEITETLLFTAARNINVQNNILPALLDGNIVILDRFTKSTIVYQGLLKNGDMDFIDQCTWKAVEELYNNDSYTVEFTLLCDPEEAIKRAAAEGHERNKNDILPIESYKKINDGYYKLATDGSYAYLKTPNCLYHVIDTTKRKESEIFDKLIGWIDPIIEAADVYEE